MLRARRGWGGGRGAGWGAHGLALWLALGGSACQDAAPGPAPGPSAHAAHASASTHAARPSAEAPGARPTTGAVPRSAPDSTGLALPDLQALESHRVAMRKRAFGLQTPVRPPADLAPALLALAPTHPEFVGTAERPAHKIVDWQRHEAMVKVRPVAGSRMESLTWATLDRGPTLVAGVAARLRAEGWLGADEEATSPLVHPRHGVLHLTLTEFEETPTLLVLRLVSSSAAPAGDGRLLLEAPPPWLPAVAALPVLGYEYGRHHKHTPRASFTDLERLAFAVQAPDRAALWAAVRTAALAAGYRAVPGDDRLLDLGQTTLALSLPDEPLRQPLSPKGPLPPPPPVPADAGPVVLHHQRPFTVEPPLTPRR